MGIVIDILPGAAASVSAVRETEPGADEPGPPRIEGYLGSITLDIAERSYASQRWTYHQRMAASFEPYHAHNAYVGVAATRESLYFDLDFGLGVRVNAPRAWTPADSGDSSTLALNARPEAWFEVTPILVLSARGDAAVGISEQPDLTIGGTLGGVLLLDRLVGSRWSRFAFLRIAYGGHDLLASDPLVLDFALCLGDPRC